MIRPENTKTSILRIPNTKSYTKLEEISKYKVNIKEMGEKMEVTKKLSSQHNSLSKFKEKFNNTSLEITYESHKTELKDDNLFYVSLTENKIVKIDNLYDFKVKREVVNLNPKKSVLPPTGMRKELQDIENLPFSHLSINHSQESEIYKTNNSGNSIILKNNMGESFAYEIYAKSKTAKNEELNTDFLISLIKKRKIFNYSDILEFFQNLDEKNVHEILKEFCFIKFGRYFLKSKFWAFKYRILFESLIEYLEKNMNSDFCKVKFFRTVNKHDKELISFVFFCFFKCIYTKDDQSIHKMYINVPDGIVSDGSNDTVPIYIMKGYNEEINVNKGNQLEKKDIVEVIHAYLKEPRSANEILNEFSHKFEGINVDNFFINNFSDIIELSNKKYISILGKSEIQLTIINLFVSLPVVKKKDILSKIKGGCIMNNKALLTDMKEMLQLLAEPKGQSWYIKL